MTDIEAQQVETTEVQPRSWAKKAAAVTIIAACAFAGAAVATNSNHGAVQHVNGLYRSLRGGLGFWGEEPSSLEIEPPFNNWNNADMDTLKAEHEKMQQFLQEEVDRIQRFCAENPRNPLCEEPPSQSFNSYTPADFDGVVTLPAPVIPEPLLNHEDDSRGQVFDDFSVAVDPPAVFEDEPVAEEGGLLDSFMGFIQDFFKDPFAAEKQAAGGDVYYAEDQAGYVGYADDYYSTTDDRYEDDTTSSSTSESESD